MSSAPSADWLNSSQSTFAGEKPNRSWSSGGRLHQRRGRGQVGVEALVEEVRPPRRCDDDAERSASSSDADRRPVGPRQPVGAGRRERDRALEVGGPGGPPPDGTRPRGASEDDDQRDHDGPPLEHLFSSPSRSGVTLAPCRAAAPGRARCRRGRQPQGQAGAARAPTGVRRLVLPQGQARPGRARRPWPRSARWPRRPASTSGSAGRCRGQRYPNGARMKSRLLLAGLGRRRRRRERLPRQPRDRRGRVGRRTTRRRKLLTYPRDQETLDGGPQAAEEDARPGRAPARERAVP